MNKFSLSPSLKCQRFSLAVYGGVIMKAKWFYIALLSIASFLFFSILIAKYNLYNISSKGKLIEVELINDDNCYNRKTYRGNPKVIVMYRNEYYKMFISKKKCLELTDIVKAKWIQGKEIVINESMIKTCKVDFMIALLVSMIIFVVDIFLLKNFLK